MKELRTLTVDLTTARSDKEYTVPPIRAMLFWCDGSLRGVSIKVGEQHRQAMGLEQVNVLPVFDHPEKIYLTNDIRSGRNTLVIFFVDEALSLSLTNAGDPVSNAELAARLGSIASFDRRGEVIWMDDFEKNLAKWVLMTQGVGASISLSTDVARNGGQSCKLVTGAAANDWAQIYRVLPYPNLTKYGIEYHVTVPDAFVLWGISFTLYDGTNLHTSQIAFNSKTAKLQYLDAAGNLVDIAASLVIAANDNLFHALKLVCDFSTNKYKRLIWNNNIYDLSQYNLYSVADATAPQLLAFLRFTTLAAANKTGYLDDVIITQNEP